MMKKITKKEINTFILGILFSFLLHDISNCEAH